MSSNLWKVCWEVSNLAHHIKWHEQRIIDKVIFSRKGNLTLCTASEWDRGGYKLDTKSSTRGLMAFTLPAAPSSCDMLSELSRLPFVLTAIVTFFRQFFAVCCPEYKNKQATKWNARVYHVIKLFRFCCVIYFIFLVMERYTIFFADELLLIDITDTQKAFHQRDLPRTEATCICTSIKSQSTRNWDHSLVLCNYNFIYKKGP